ncbi:HAMP domain-containing histidine kinase [bacterium]|nr:HAMP domain-containing histidine kinase [bacterium]
MTGAREQIGVEIVDTAIKKKVVHALNVQGFSVADSQNQQTSTAAWLIDGKTAKTGFIRKVNVPVVVLLDSPDISSASELISQGAVDCWLLPFDPDAHGARLEKLLGDARLGRLGTGYGLSALLAHEMKSPIIAVLQQVMALERGIYGSMDSRAEKVLQRMHLRLDALTGIIDEWLLLSKAMYGSPIVSKKVELLPLLEDALAAVVDKAQDAHVAIRLRRPSGVYVSGDGKALRLILVNLLDNAIKYNKSGGRIDIIVDVISDSVKISIKDDGPGIAHEDQERIFHPFVRIEKNSDVEGAGLGLALVRSVVEAHGGNISVISAPGQGSQFIVSLPFHTNIHA